MDSDGDGKTNGQELGDPTCAWTPAGAPPSRTENITHPGTEGSSLKSNVEDRKLNLYYQIFALRKYEHQRAKGQALGGLKLTMNLIFPISIEMGSFISISRDEEGGVIVLQK